MKIIKTEQEEWPVMYAEGAEVVFFDQLGDRHEGTVRTHGRDRSKSWWYVVATPNMGTFIVEPERVTPKFQNQQRVQLRLV